MMRITSFFILLQIFTISRHASAAVDIKPDPARIFSAHQQEGGDEMFDQLGSHGAWLIGSQGRFEELTATLQKHKAAIENQLRNVDFAKENLVVVFHFGDEGDRFVLRDVSIPPQAAAPVPNVQLNVEFGMSYVVYEQKRTLTPALWRCFSVPVPKFRANTISVYTYAPTGHGPHADLKSAVLDWEWTISPETGEAAGGLCGTLTPGPNPPADDILLQFTLKADQAGKAQYGRFARQADSVHVWDGKYSKGYRNHSFEVVSPDGKTHLLRPEKVNGWDKNVPHPVAITKDKPYTLPNWVEGDTLKSLKALGLDVSQKGAYAITGIYQEVRERSQDDTPEIWGGTLRTNTVIVERK